MGYAHIPKFQKWHAYAQVRAGSSWQAVQATQARLFGSLAIKMSRRSIMRAYTDGLEGNAARTATRVHPTRTLTSRHERLIDAALERDSAVSNAELCSMLSHASW